MGMLDFITGGPDGQVRRQVKKVQNRYGQPEEREAAAIWLAQNGSEVAIRGLLGRFDFSIENQMKDGTERNQVFDLLMGLGPTVLDATRAHLNTCKQVALPLRLLEAVSGPSIVVQALLDLLDLEVAKDDFKPERKRTFLIKLAEFKDPRIVSSAIRFLKDFDEGVRYAAVEAILSQETEAGRSEMLDALANREEESNRLRVRLAEAFNYRRWPVTDRAADLIAAPPMGWRVRDGFIVPE